MKVNIKHNIVIPSGGDSIRIKRGRGKGKISATLLHFIFQDKDTSQYIILVPSLDISAYGETKEKAVEMMNYTVSSYLRALAGLTPKFFQAELSQFGWKQNKLKHKEYSKIFVDREGELNGFNAVENKIEVGITSL
jgi:hypothetical protein